MTQNQIAYWQNVETKRSNLEKEAQGRTQLAETSRHNLATEYETNRHNVRTEDESERHNRSTEQIDLGRLNETVRHNLVTERQGDRSLDLGFMQLDESRRHNVATEGATNRSINLSEYDALTRRLVSEESARHNMSQEQINSALNAIQAAANVEVARHNAEAEGIAWNQNQIAQYNAETSRARSEAQNVLDNARTEYTQLQKALDLVKTNSNANLSTAQIRELDARLAKYSTEISKMESDITRNRFQNFNDTARTYTQGVRDMSKEVREWLGFIYPLQ